MEWVEPDDFYAARQKIARLVMAFSIAVTSILAWLALDGRAWPEGQLMSALLFAMLTASVAFGAELTRETRGKIWMHDWEVSFVDGDGKILWRTSVIQPPRFVLGRVPPGAVFIRTKMGTRYWFRGPASGPLIGDYYGP